jgi:hypothetical protein
LNFAISEDLNIKYCKKENFATKTHLKQIFDKQNKLYEYLTDASNFNISPTILLLNILFYAAKGTYEDLVKLCKLVKKDIFISKLKNYYVELNEGVSRDILLRPDL